MPIPQRDREIRNQGLPLYAYNKNGRYELRGERGDKEYLYLSTLVGKGETEHLFGLVPWVHCVGGPYSHDVLRMMNYSGYIGIVDARLMRKRKNGYSGSQTDSILSTSAEFHS